MAEGEPHAKPGGTFAPFSHPAFRAIWTANLASNLGTAIQSVAAAWLMTELTRSHQLIALVQASVTVPIMLLGVFAGAIADNFDRRRVMLAAQAGMLVTSAMLAITSWQGLMTPYLLLGFTLTMGAGTALNAPAWQASVRQQVGLADLPHAIALNTLAFNLARSAGPALGGVLISVINVSIAFAVNSASFLAMIFVLLRWRPEPRPVTRRPMLPAILTGVRFCAGSAPIRRILLHGLALGFGICCFQALIPSIVHDRLGGSEFDFGLLLACFGIGSIAGALSLAPVRRRWQLGRTLAAATALQAAALLALTAATTVLACLPLAFAAGAGWVWILTSLNVSMQLRSPEEILGRCLSIYQAATFGGMALGAWTWGALADAWGLAAALALAGIYLVAAVPVLAMAAPIPPASGHR